MTVPSAVEPGLQEYRRVAWYLGKWLLLAGPVGCLAGSACALFLWLLDVVTQTRFAAPVLIYFLPLAGVLSAWIYQRWGGNADRGNHLIVEEIHEPGGGVPLRMAPLVLLGTLLTHLCGGSAGREGTAVQMGGSLAAGWARLIPGLSSHDVQTLLMVGVASGFGGVFGTPLAGTVFALEVLVVGRMHSAALWPCLCGAVIADQVCLAWGSEHTHYHIASSLGLLNRGPLATIDGRLLGLAALAGVAFGLTSMAFARAVHWVQAECHRRLPNPLWRPVLGGSVVIGLMLLIGTQDYLGLGVTAPHRTAVTILSCFEPGGAQHWSWLAKLLFTVITVGTGFKGGEVTPLFFIGAALGNSLGILCGVPVDLFAALGFLAVFAGATNTPLACTVMGVELFGAEYTVYFAVACTVSYLCSGHAGIYKSQRVPTRKAS